jgi:hypothetical protein
MAYPGMFQTTDEQSSCTRPIRKYAVRTPRLASIVLSIKKPRSCSERYVDALDDFPVPLDAQMSIAKDAQPHAAPACSYNTLCSLFGPSTFSGRLIFPHLVAVHESSMPPGPCTIAVDDKVYSNSFVLILRERCLHRFVSDGR